jgi:anti-sigma regulatory factor (Ser/Thr protein kinase)
LETDIVAFLNPDRVPQSAATDDSSAVIYPWLRDLVGKTCGGSSRLSRELQHDISLVIFELLGNVRQHARLSRRSLCSMNLFVTEGGNGNRLYVTVLDTGIGMPSALGPMPFDRDVAPSEQVAAAFNGHLPHRERDRGRGLHRIAGLVERLSGQLFVATGPSEHGAVVVQHTGGSDVPVSASFVPDLAVRGTVVMLTLPIPGSGSRHSVTAEPDGERR